MYQTALLNMKNMVRLFKMVRFMDVYSFSCNHFNEHQFLGHKIRFTKPASKHTDEEIAGSCNHFCSCIFTGLPGETIAKAETWIHGSLVVVSKAEAENLITFR